MNTVSNELSSMDFLANNLTSPPKGNGEVARFFKPCFFRGTGVSKDTRLSLRSARSVVPLPHPCPTRFLPCQPSRDSLTLGGSDRHHGQDGVLLPITLDGPMLRFIPKS